MSGLIVLFVFACIAFGAYQWIRSLSRGGTGSASGGTTSGSALSDAVRRANEREVLRLQGRAFEVDVSDERAAPGAPPPGLAEFAALVERETGGRLGSSVVRAGALQAALEAAFEAQQPSRPPRTQPAPARAPARPAAASTRRPRPGPSSPQPVAPPARPPLEALRAVPPLRRRHALAALAPMEPLSPLAPRAVRSS